MLGERLHSVDRKELRAAIHAFVAEITLDFGARKARVAYILPIRRSAEVLSKGSCGGLQFRLDTTLMPSLGMVLYVSL
jgi:hypothetical protein